MNLRFKEGQMVKMTGHDDMIVEGAIGCTITTETPEDSIIEESIGDEIVLTLENGFSREVTFYERNGIKTMYILKETLIQNVLNL